ncbi:MAG: hypothetical protein ACKO2G_10530 [Verrucomicrobiales bacterium]
MKNHPRPALRLVFLAAVAMATTFGTTGCFYSTVAGFENPAYNSSYVAAPVYAEQVYSEPVAVAPVVVPVARPYYRPFYRPYDRPYYGGGWPSTSLSFSYNYVDGCW